MFKCDYKNLRLSFNEFHNLTKKNMPEYGEFCLLELKDGGYTAGKWYPNDYGKDVKKVSGEFVRGLADTISLEEVKRWHSLARYDLTNCLEDEDVNYINLGVEEEGKNNIQMEGFKSCDEGEYPKQEQYCLLILKDGSLAAGRWDWWQEGVDGGFIYASALASHDMEKVWAWMPLSSDKFFEMEEESERQRREEEELNKDPEVDEKLFKYGLDINTYYEKANEKLREKYPWATVNQMKKAGLWEIVPKHGKYVFGQDQGNYGGMKIVEDWKDGSTAEEFIDFLCEYSKKSVENSDPEKKFKFGMDIEVYLEKAYQNVKKDYTWVNKKMLNKSLHYDIKQINGDWEFVRRYKGDKKYFIEEYGSAEDFIESVERSYQQAALEENPVVAVYSPDFGCIEINGWFLEKYMFSKLKTGDYKVNVTAGNRSTGGSREFFITPSCFEAKAYEEFLDRYLQIVPETFGLSKKDLIKDTGLKHFLGY